MGKRLPPEAESALQSMVRFLEPVRWNIIMTGEPMADETKKETVSLAELMVSTLAMTDASVKLSIKKGLYTEEEFQAQLGAERANYLAILKRLH
jgi:hypothetical protein